MKNKTITVPYSSFSKLANGAKLLLAVVDGVKSPYTNKNLRSSVILFRKSLDELNCYGKR